MSKSVRSLLFLGLLGVVIAAIFIFRNQTTYPRPTREFYVNDYAEKLSDAAEDIILFESGQMYEISQDYDNGGTQVVIATFAVESLDEIEESYDATELYRQWGIGKNDMGALILMFFVGEDVYVRIEPGYRMEPILLPGEHDSYIAEAIDNEDDISRGAVHLIYLLLSDIYGEAYELEYNDTIEVKMEEFDAFALDYVPSDSDFSSIQMSYLGYLFSPFSSWGMRIFSGVMALLFFGLGGGFLRVVGQGGRSGGMGIFRRRR